MIASDKDQPERPLFSILLPSRNRLDLLKCAIDSVLRQEFSSFEIIVSDNCSDDDYAHYFQFLNDPRIKLVRTESCLPVTENWNNALYQSTGKYVIMLGDDDALAPGTLSRFSRLIEEHDAPEVIFAMAYHYAYPKVIPHSPAGYFATVMPRPIYSDQEVPTFLDVEQARHFGRRALHFRHLFGFNSQFFVWSREFIDSLREYGPFFQSPYPDYYASFVTMLKAERILVEPEPRVIIGVSPKSFGFYFHQDQVNAGNEMLKLSEDDAYAVRDLVPGADAALDLPGSPHYRNWLIAALFVKRNFANIPGLTIDLRRFRKMQLYEAAYQFYYNGAPERRARGLKKDLSEKESRLFDRFSWSFALMRRAKEISQQQIHDSLFGLFRIYPPAKVIGHDIGPHSTITDAVNWLERRRSNGSIFSKQMIALRWKQIRKKSFYRNQWNKIRSRDWAKRQVDRIYTKLGAKPPAATAEEVNAKKSLPKVSSYERVQLDREKLRRDIYRAGEQPGLLSFLTSAYNTPPQFLALLAESVLGQDSKDVFEWVLLDNGSTNPATVELLNRIALDPRVRFERASSNRGILGGMRRCLEMACGRYVLPLDSDDLITADCARVIAASLEMHGFPAILYTDEDKIDGKRRFEAYHKTDWDEVLFSHSCFIAHLNAFDRQLALKLGCYTDPAAEGSHDWDTFVRFVNTGHVPQHVPEVLYSWRVHSGSTSADYTTKPYVVESQRGALRRFIENRPTRFQYAVELSPLFGGTPDWRFKPQNCPERAPLMQITESGSAELLSPDKVVVQRVLGGSLSLHGLKTALQNAPAEVEFVHLLDSTCRPDGDIWVEEALALFDIYTDTAIVGGRLHDGEQIVAAGYVYGFGEPVWCPDKGRKIADPGYFAQMWKPRAVAAVSHRHCIVRVEFLLRALEQMPEEIDCHLLGAWLGAQATRDNQRVIYSPFLSALAKSDTDRCITADSKRQFVAFNGDLLGDRVGYSPTLCRLQDHAYQCGPEEEPIERPSYAQWRMHRSTYCGAAGQPSSSLRCSLITSVYEKTNVQYFRELAESVERMALGAHEWIVLAHGSISDELKVELDRIESLPEVKLFYLPRNIGIARASKFCLEKATGDWILPVDADDMLVSDALSIVADAIARNPDARVFYSDEDVHMAGNLTWPCHRPAFDPVLASCQSYIAHAIVFDRALGMELGVYSDRSMEFALDWDIISRFPLHGFEPVHIPECLYHWRKHEASISQSGETFKGSMQAIRNMLDRVRSSSENPARYEVAHYPIALGIRDSYLRRKPIDGPSIHGIFLGTARGRQSWDVGPDFTRTTTLNAPLGQGAMLRLREIIDELDEEYVVLLGEGVVPQQTDGLWDAVKLFELTPSLSAVSGPLLAFDGTIVRGAPVVLPRNQLIDPLVGKMGGDPGPYSIAAKPHCVAAPCIDLMIARCEDVRAALDEAPSGVRLRNLSLWLGVHFARRKRRVAYNPLFAAVVTAPDRLVGDGIEGQTRAWSWLSRINEFDEWRPMALAGFEQAALFHQ